MLTFFVVTSTVLVAFGWLFIIAFAIESLNYTPDPAYVPPIQARRLTWLLRIAHGGLLLAYGVLVLHLLRADGFPYSANPYEIRYPLEKATVYLFVQMSYALLLYRQLQHPNAPVAYPSAGRMIRLALVGTLASLLYHSVYNVSLCCENPLATYWGFPFSWLYGIAQDPPFEAYTRWTAYAYVTHYAGQMVWRISVWKLAADFCFWWSVGFLFSLGFFNFRQNFPKD